MLDRLNRLEQIKNTTVPIHILDGFDYDEVTEIFVRVNSKEPDCARRSWLSPGSRFGCRAW